MDAWSASERATEGAPAQGSYIEDGIPLTMSMGAGEQVRGILPSARLGLTDYDLIVTDRRIVAAKIGSSGLAGAAGGLIGTAVSLKGQDARSAQYGGMDLNQILTSNKKNFDVPLAAVERGEFNAGISMVTMPTLSLWAAGKKIRFMFTHSFWKKDEGQVAYAKDLLTSTMPGKIEFKRI